MRRRIEFYHDGGGYIDVTESPHHYLSNYGGVLSLDTPPKVLRNEALWSKLEAAKKLLSEVQDEVYNELIKDVPLDETEIRLGLYMWDMMAHHEGHAKFEVDEFQRVEAELREHAKKV